MSRLSALPSSLLCIALLSLLTVPSIAQETKDKLVGEWKASLDVDEDKLRELLGEGAGVQDQIDNYKEELKGITIELKLTDEGESSMTTSGLPGAQSSISNEGTWKIDKEETREIDGKSVKVVTLTGKISDSGEQTTFELFLLDDDQFRMETDDIRDSLFKFPVFERQQ